MKRRLLILSIIALVIIPLLSGCSSPDLVIGRWTWNYTWSGSEPATQTLEIMQDHTFTVAGMNFGTWTLSGRRITLTSTLIGQTTYTGMVSSDGTVITDGTMSNSFGNSGTWNAVRLSETTMY